MQCIHFPIRSGTLVCGKCGLRGGVRQGIPWQEIYFSPWRDFYFAWLNKNHAMALPGWLWRNKNHAMACPAGLGEIKITPWLGPAGLAKKKSRHGSRARPAAARTGQDPHLNTFCAYACAPAWGEKSCRRKIQPWLPAWLAKIKSRHGWAQLAWRKKNHAMALAGWLRWPTAMA